MPTLWNDMYFPNCIKRYIAHQNAYHKIHVGSNWSLQICNDHVHKYTYDSKARPWKALLVALELYPQSPSSSSCSSCSHLFTIFSNLPLLTYLNFREYMMPQSISSSHSSNSAFLHHLFTSLNTIWLWGVSSNYKGLHLSLKNSLRNHW